MHHTSCLIDVLRGGGALKLPGLLWCLAAGPKYASTAGRDVVPCFLPDKCGYQTGLTTKPGQQVSLPIFHLGHVLHNGGWVAVPAWLTDTKHLTCLWIEGLLFPSFHTRNFGKPQSAFPLQSHKAKPKYNGQTNTHKHSM